MGRRLSNTPFDNDRNASVLAGAIKIHKTVSVLEYVPMLRLKHDLFILYYCMHCGGREGYFAVKCRLVEHECTSAIE
eukprot:m.916983 g.916983  ORF g.916983 m.916983 type:complete len:77 (-) comp23738_c0_seq20:21-251(-)